ncbi:MAG TPA: F0F1 ATP synthase subunit B [Candidatus Paceibacterota bacterium]|jgi:F-type H+-transporting ATPase subunit b|nr:F0F1 ATP synthase subunit B [Candidatus Paceibacterota bacterium]
MDSLIATFHIDWKIIVAQAVNFGIVFLVLYLFALKPLKKLMSDRQQRIENGLADAKANAELIQKTRKEYDDILNKARALARDIFEQGKHEAEANKADMISKANHEIEAMIINGKKILEVEKVKMMEEAKKEIVSLVVKATEKLLESNTDESYDAKTLKNMKNI